MFFFKANSTTLRSPVVALRREQHQQITLYLCVSLLLPVLRGSDYVGHRFGTNLMDDDFDAVTESSCRTNST
eukprot:544635-Hanusia_phi.AAC.1